MGKKGRRCKTRWRRLPMGGERPDEGEEEDCCEVGGGDCPGRCATPAAALGGRERTKGGGGSDGAASPLQNGPRQATTVSSSSASHHAPYKGGSGGQRSGRGSFNGRRNGGGGGAAVTDGSKKGAAGGSGSVYTFNEDEYTKITTPRQDVLFKKGYLMARKKDTPTTSTNGTPSSTEATNGEATPNGTSGPQNGDASSSSDQTYSAQVSGSGAEDESGCNGYAYVNGYTNGYSYGGGYHMDQGGAVPNGGAYFVNGGSYELYDPYAAAAAAAAAAAGYAFPYVGAPPPHPPPPHTLPPLHAIDWYASRPPGSTGNVGDVQWCHLVASPGYSETRRKRYSTDSQNCSPPSSESTGPPGSPQEEAISSSGGDPCHAHQPIPQYHHAHVFQGPHPHAAAYVYPGYLFGPAVYSVNGVPLAATPIHPLHGISQSIHVHPSAAVAAPAPVPGPQAGVPVSAAPGSDGGSQRRRKKKRRRKRKRGLTDDASEETSSEVGEEEGVNATGTCGACSGGGSRGEEFDEDDDEEDGTVVVVRLGNVVPLVMSQPPQSMAVSPASQPYPQDPGLGGEEDDETNDMREGEASSTDCSELSGQPESSSVSGGEEAVQGGEVEDRGTQVDDEECSRHNPRDEVKTFKVSNGVSTKDAEVSVQRDLLPLDAPKTTKMIEDKDVNTDAETREVSTQSPPEMAVQVNEPVTPPPSPVTPARHTHVPEASTIRGKSADAISDNKPKECSKKTEVEVPLEAREKAEKVHDKQSPPKEETPRQKRRNGGRGRNNNNRPTPVIQPIEVPVEVEKAPGPAVRPRTPVEVYIEKTEALQPVQIMPAPAQSDPKTAPTPVEAASEAVDAEPAPVHVENKPVREEPISVRAVEKPVSVEPIPKKVEVEPTAVAVEPTLGKTEAQELHVQPSPATSTPDQVPAPKAPEPFKAAEPRIEPPNTLPLDTFTFKPEPYKHPMLKSAKPEKKEEEPDLRKENAEVNGEKLAEEGPETMEEEKSSPSRHLRDMPRKRSRLKKPPEREQTPGLAEKSNEDDEEEKTPDQEVTNAPAFDEERHVTKESGEIDNKPHGQETQQAEAPQPAGQDSTAEESLTEVVSKWLEENADALPDSIEEIKGQEKTEEVAEVGEAAEGETLTGSKNGVGNPFPAPSSKYSEETGNACERENVDDERVCVSNARANEVRKDGPVKRVANRKIGTGDEGKVYHQNEEEYGEEYGRRREDGNSSVEEESGEWEPMTVEPPKMNFTDLETWKRLRGGLGASSEALRSLGSYRGTDDEEEEEGMKVRLSMCDPTSSVAKYYCLGGRETKSPSPEEEKNPVADSSRVPAPTDSGVQSDEEDETITTGEEAMEGITNSGRTRQHKTMGLGKTAAFVVRQIGTTDSSKGPFPCGICCIIQ